MITCPRCGEESERWFATMINGRDFCHPCAATYPGKGWVWSKRLVKWRRPAMRAWMADRQGIHIILGLLVVALSAGFGLVVGDKPITWLVGGGLVAGVATWIFLRYEEVEAKEISDDAYIDIGGYLGGILAGVALLAVVGGILRVLGVLQ